ncbi:MAG: polysaccharide deacetylase family protein [Bacteriovorax sp.]
MNQKKSLAYPLALCLFISSCATHRPENGAAAVANSEYAPSDRAPSSSEKLENLEDAFDIVMKSADPEKEFSDYLGRMKSIYVRAEAYVVDFDRELDESVASSSKLDLNKSATYKKLMVMWGLRERMQDKLIFFYLKLADIVRDKTNDASKREMAKKILRSFNKKLVSSIPVEQFAFDNFKAELAATIKERRAMLKSASSSEGIPAPSFKDESEKLQALRINRNKFREMGRSELNYNDELNQTIDKEADQLQLVDSKVREPQSELKFYPSTGPNGNVMGLIFPKNVWALTYDDGPNPVHTPAILKNLEDLGIKATFFWLAGNVVRYQSVVDMVKEKGMVRANHSWSHPQLPKLDAAGLQKEIVQSTQVETKSYGEKIKFFRCPYGAGNSVPRIRQMIADLDMIHVFWNVDTLDWQDKDPDSILARAKKQMQAAGHGVILFHDIHPQSVIASRKLVEWSKTLKGTANEIRWVTLPEIVDEMNGVKKD